MFKYHYLILLLATSLPVIADDKETIYEYKNSDGKVEFTDVPKKNQQPVDELQYKKMTEQEKADGKEKLDQIMEDDQALDTRLAKEREQDLAAQKQRATEQKLRDTSNDDAVEVEPQNDNYYPNGRIGRPINRPIQPIVRPRPR